jgi:polyisoprenoid-binding protein YceI
MNSVAWSAEIYTVDANHTTVEFAINHMVIAKVKGTFHEFEGTIRYDEQNFKDWSIQGAIQVKSIDTGNMERDNHLRSADFFDVEKYPQITFQSKNIVKKGDGYIVVGTFTLHGVAKEVKIPFKITGAIKDPYGNERLGLEAALTINRQDYGLTWNKTLETGQLIVGNDVEINLYVEAIKAKKM